MIDSSSAESSPTTVAPVRFSLGVWDWLWTLSFSLFWAFFDWLADGSRISDLLAIWIGVVVILFLIGVLFGARTSKKRRDVNAGRKVYRRAVMIMALFGFVGGCSGLLDRQAAEAGYQQLLASMREVAVIARNARTIEENQLGLLRYQFDAQSGLHHGLPSEQRIKVAALDAAIALGHTKLELSSAIVAIATADPLAAATLSDQGRRAALVEELDRLDLGLEKQAALDQQIVRAISEAFTKHGIPETQTKKLRDRLAPDLVGLAESQQAMVLPFRHWSRAVRSLCQLLEQNDSRWRYAADQDQLIAADDFVDPLAAALGAVEETWAALPL